MNVEEMIHYLKCDKNFESATPIELAIAAKLRAAENLLHYSKIVSQEIAGGGHDYQSHRLWQTAEAYERAGGEG